MASKMFSIRISEEMLNELKEVCGELNINVTDAVKIMISKLIKERKLDNKIENEDEYAEDFFNGLFRCDTNKINEDISYIVGNYFDEMKEFVMNSKVMNIDCEKIARDKIIQFKKEKGNEFLDNITNTIGELFVECIINEYKTIEEQLKFEEEERKQLEIEKYIDIMETLKIKEPKLFNELILKYSNNIGIESKLETGVKNYKELKELINNDEKEKFLKNSLIK